MCLNMLDTSSRENNFYTNDQVSENANWLLGSAKSGHTEHSNQSVA